MATAAVLGFGMARASIEVLCDPAALVMPDREVKISTKSITWKEALPMGIYPRG
jgi:hypothetical protein